MVCPKITVQCQSCKAIFLRYRYGVGRRRSRRWGKSRRRRGNPYMDSPHASVRDSCIICTGRVEAL